MYNLNYSYAVPRIKSMETKLLDRGLLNRIMSEQEARDALFILS